jgi:hypothetical protein
MAASNLLLRVGDPESARVVAFLNRKGKVIGAGCLISADKVLTCWHVVKVAAKPAAVTERLPIRMRLCGIDKAPEVEGRLEEKSDAQGLAGDLAIVRIVLPRGQKLRVPETEFAAPFRHGGKAFSVVGFPAGDSDGYYASGVMRGANIAGLVQLDGEGKILVQGGFSGAPVWSADLSAYVGIVVSEYHEYDVAWCIPAGVLCQFHPHLPVRFRIPRSDRPEIHDFGEDDPNVPLFGNVSDNGKRRLSVTRIKKQTNGKFRVDVRYECLRGEPARGRFVTFITHPSFSNRKEDAYELFSEVRDGVATNHFWTESSFTIAAIGDGGDTALTYDIKTFSGRPKGFK